ncbi:MAG TPA: hypothetical protein PLB55_15175 [Prosthecobacter sp.]|nr:hypothetical protein [Prosthecobacter sp.]
MEVVGPFQLRNASGIVTTDMTLAGSDRTKNPDKPLCFLAPQGVE